MQFFCNAGFPANAVFCNAISCNGIYSFFVNVGTMCHPESVILYQEIESSPALEAKVQRNVVIMSITRLDQSCIDLGKVVVRWVAI